MPRGIRHRQLTLPTHPPHRLCALDVYAFAPSPGAAGLDGLAVLTITSGAFSVDLRPSAGELRGLALMLAATADDMDHATAQLGGAR